MISSVFAVLLLSAVGCSPATSEAVEAVMLLQRQAKKLSMVPQVELGLGNGNNSQIYQQALAVAVGANVGSEFPATPAAVAQISDDVLASVASQPQVAPQLASLPLFALGAEGVNSCPPNYRGIGDERSCKQAMSALKLVRWGQKSTWLDHPGGCFRSPQGSVFLNNHTGSGNAAHAPICEKEFEIGVKGLYESRDAAGKWWSVAVSAKIARGMYSVALDDGTQWAGVLDFNIRRMAVTKPEEAAIEEEVALCSEVDPKAFFVAGCNGTNACPDGFKGIGDERSCKQAMLSLGLKRYGRKASWGMYPAGCFQNPNGDVYLNNHTGWGKAGYAPVCEKDFEIGVKDHFELRAADGNYTAVTIDSKEEDGTYTTVLADGTHWQGVSQYILRRQVGALPPLKLNVSADADDDFIGGQDSAAYILGDVGGNRCPEGFQGIGDERSCRQALFSLHLGKYGRKASWAVYPAGCFLGADGTVNLNNNTGSGKDGYAPVCQARFPTGVEGKFEARDADGTWWPVTLTAESEDRSFNVTLSNGVEAVGVSEFDLRKADLPKFIIADDGAAECPVDYKGIGDKRTCVEAMNELDVGPYQRKSSWGGFPAGCFKNPTGDVFLNQRHNGWGKNGSSPVCERDFENGVKFMYEVLEAGSEHWWPVSIAGRHRDGSYTIIQNDGTAKRNISQFTIRRALKKEGAALPAEKDVNPFIATAPKPNSSFVLGLPGTNACPLGSSPVDAEEACKRAIVELHLGPFGRSDVWMDHPGGCFRNPDGQVYLNTGAGAQKENRTPICDTTAQKKAESRVADDFAVGDTGTGADHRGAGDFAVGGNGSTACPSGFKGIGDERTCRIALRALGAGAWQGRRSWGDYPEGCFRTGAGKVFVNNNTGSARMGSSPICERDLEVGVGGLYESRDAEGAWWPVMVAARRSGAYDVLLDDGTNVTGIVQYNIRRSANISVELAASDAQTNFVLGSDGENACPPSYARISNETACKQAMAELGLGPFGRNDIWSDHPGGCFRNPGGDVYLNSGDGAGKEDRAPICEKGPVAEDPVQEMVRENGTEVAQEKGLVAEDPVQEMVQENDTARLEPPGGVLGEAAEEQEEEIEAALEKELDADDQTQEIASERTSFTLGDEGNSSSTTEGEASASQRDAEFDAIAAEDASSESSGDMASSAPESLADFAVGENGSNACPPSYKGIGDPMMCKKALRALSLGPFGRKASWGDFPAGCHRRLTGEVNLNNNTGAGRPGNAPICEKEVLGVAGLFESRDASGAWWNVTLVSREVNSTYSVVLDDGTRVAGVWEYHVRRRQANGNASYLAKANVAVHEEHMPGVEAELKAEKAGGRAVRNMLKNSMKKAAKDSKKAGKANKQQMNRRMHQQVKTDMENFGNRRDVLDQALSGGDTDMSKDLLHEARSVYATAARRIARVEETMASDGGEATQPPLDVSQ